MTIKKLTLTPMGRISMDRLHQDIVYHLYRVSGAPDPNPDAGGVYDGVTFMIHTQQSGAVVVYIVESTEMTHLARPGLTSGSGNLDELDGNVTAFDVPNYWRKAYHDAKA